MDDCVFCAIVAGEAEASIVYEDETVVNGCRILRPDNRDPNSTIPVGKPVFPPSGYNASVDAPTNFDPNARFRAPVAN
jgi:hypothetical protein